MKDRKTIRIFISSPSDVQQERNIARNVLSELNDIYSRYLNIKILMWEDFPLTADATYQEGINYFLNHEVIDIAVFILWSRLGTQLSSKFKKPDGSPYKSGTEYEFDLMMQLFKEKQWPRILTYVKKTKKASHAANDDELEEMLLQRKYVKKFIDEHFHDNDSNSNYAYMEFVDATSFEQKFRTHIKKVIEPIIGKVGEIKEWYGNPFVGLNSFEYDQSPIFFGRKQLVYETAAKLHDQDNPTLKKSLIILGESGSGKSSFVKAGLLPFLCKNNEQNDQYIIMSPSMFNRKIYHGMVEMIATRYPFMRGNPFIDELRCDINENTNFKHLQYAFSQNEHEDHILLIDQFEELFNAQIPEDERVKVLMLLKGIISTYCMSVFISMRSDFYNRFSLYEDLAKIKEYCEIVDIPVIGATEIAEIVEEPARKACLKWEVNSNGYGLNRKIIKEASIIKDLPLIEFALSELYNCRNENDTLTFEAYDRIGGLKGAIGTYADKFYQELGQSEREAFNDILGFVITESSYSNGVHVRKTSLKTDIQKTPLHASVLKKLINSHLFVSSKDSYGRATVTITHEILIYCWSAVADWTKKEKEFITRNSYYEQLSQYWVSYGKSSKDLITGRSSLLEAEYHDYRNHNRLSETVQEFFRESFRENARKGIIAQTFLLIALLFILVYSVSMKVMALRSAITDELSGFNSMSLPGIILLWIPFILLLGHNLVIKFKGLPKYKTVNSSIVIWTASLLLLIVGNMINQADISGKQLVFLLCSLPIGLVLASYVCDHFRFKKWEYGFVPYKFSDEFTYKFNGTAISLAIIGLGVLLSSSYISILLNNEAQIKTQYETIYMLYDGLDNISDKLSPTDIYILNSARIKYIETFHEDEITDGIVDDHDLNIAKSLYHLHRPHEAYSHLFPWQNDTHLFLGILCKGMAGRYEEAAELMEAYIPKKRIDRIGKANTSDLIWLAEKAGRFDLAEDIYEFINDSIPAMADNSVSYANYGHIELSRGNHAKAEALYRDAMLHAEESDITIERMSTSITKDFHLFSEHGIIPDAEMAEISGALGIKFLPAFTKGFETKDDMVFTDLTAQWMYRLNDIITLIIDISKDTILYNYVDRSNNILTQDLTRYKVARKGDRIFLNELSLINDTYALYEIKFRADKGFELTVLNHINEEEIGTVKTFSRAYAL